MSDAEKASGGDVDAAARVARDAIERAHAEMRLEGVHCYEMHATTTTYRNLQRLPGIEEKGHPGRRYLEMMTCNGPVSIYQSRIRT